jgi:chromosome segregation ATPase
MTVPWSWPEIIAVQLDRMTGSPGTESQDKSAVFGETADFFAIPLLRSPRVIEPILYFTLGLLTSGLVALMIGPAIWARAVRLTRRRIEASQPLSLAEIRADRDQLRAEFAVTARRLELNIADLRSKSADQRIELGRALGARDEIEVERQRLAAELKVYERELSTRGEGLAELQAAVRGLEAELDQRNRLVSGLESRIRELNSEIDAQRLEISTLNTRLAALGSQSESHVEARAAAEARADNLAKEIERRGTVITEERDRADRLLAEIRKLRNTNRLPMPMPQSALVSQLEPVAADDNERPAINRLEAENAALEARLRDLSDERDRLAYELQANRVRELSNPVAQADLAFLRDRLGEIATRLTTGSTDAPS